MTTLQDSSRDFLSRSGDCLAKAEEGPEMLLYVALELRLGIEARLHEYLNAAKEKGSGVFVDCLVRLGRTSPSPKRRW